MKSPSLLLFCLLLVAHLLQGADEKIPVTKADELPRFTYQIEGKAEAILDDDDTFAALAVMVEADYRSVLDTYEIEDHPTLRGYLGTLRSLEIMGGEYDAALERIELIRSLEDKPADRLTSGLISESLVRVLKAGGSEDLLARFEAEYRPRVEALPFEVVQESLEQTKGQWEIWSENLFRGVIRGQIEPSVEETGEISGDIAAQLIGMRNFLQNMLPLQSVVVSVLGDFIEANRVVKPEIWSARNVDLPDSPELSPVLVAIWDSGIDIAIFTETGQAWVNEAETENGEDDDGNGFVDDTHGFAHDMKSRRTTGILFPMTDEQMALYPEMKQVTKGFLDLQAALDTDEAAALKKTLSELDPDDVSAFLENLSLFGNYVHGTHVAGIASAGNPAIRLQVARISFDYRSIPEAPTLEETVRSVRSAHESVEYFKKTGVRVVNMSWGGSQAGLEAVFEANGLGDDSEMRAEMARIFFRLGYDALVEAMASAPEILFIPAAGNSDNTIEFDEIIPSSIDLPNVLVVGAVDQAGDETGFTSFGRNVRVHANGFEVESYLPGGDRMKLSGTSMSAPNVTNLAAKLFALDPSLTPEQVIDLILLGADTSEDGRLHLIHPKRSIEMLLLRLKQD
jgi:hypothetical protein